MKNDSTFDSQHDHSQSASYSINQANRKSEGKITNVIIENMMNWRHSGFNVYCGNAIWPHNEDGLENLARYIIRASFSQERMTYIAANDSCDGVAKVIYKSKDGRSTKTFDALDGYLSWPC